MCQMLQTGEWQIADTCRELIEAIPSRMHDEKKPGDILKVTGDPLDDVADSARYGIYTFIEKAEKPETAAAEEDIQALREAGDYTSAMIRYLQMNAQPPYRPPTIGRYGAARYRRSQWGY